MQLQRIALAVLPVLVFAGPTAAQSTCARGEPIGWLGLGYRCTSCTISSDTTNPSRFATEPSITGVDPESPLAGQLRPGDVIVSINGELITSARGGMMLTRARPGDVITLQVRRGDAVLTLQSRPLPGRCPPTSASARAVAVGGAGAGGTATMRGAAAGPITTSGLGFSVSCSDCSATRGSGGASWAFASPPAIATVAPGSVAARAGIRPGDRIVAIDGVGITTAAAGERFGNIAPGAKISLTLRRGTEQLTTELTAPEAIQARATYSVEPTAAGTISRARDNTLRYAGRLGTVDIDVRGGSSVIVTETADEVIITTADAVIRLRKQ